MHEAYDTKEALGAGHGPATSHETTARSGITTRAGVPRHRRAMRRAAHPARVPPKGSSCDCRADRS